MDHLLFEYEMNPSLNAGHENYITRTAQEPARRRIVSPATGIIWVKYILVDYDDLMCTIPLQN